MTDERRILLLGCVKQKHRTGTYAARDLYTSPLFRKRRCHAEATGCPWLILSAKHGLVDPAAPLSYYDQTLNTMGVVARRAWGQGVVRQLEERFGDMHGTTFEIHAGDRYVQAIAAELKHQGASIKVPTEGLSLGRQLRWYAERAQA